MHGSAFGAVGYMRLSYGSLSLDRCIEAVGQLRAGLMCLLELSERREREGGIQC